MVYRIVPKTEDELYHYGVLGMRWGVRRYQNYDGSRIKGGPVTNPTHAGHPKSIRDTVVGGQGGKAVGNARLAATANPKTGAEDATQPKKKSAIDVIAGPEVRKGKGKDNSSNLKEFAQDLGNAAEGAGKVAEDMKKRDPKVKAANEKQKMTQSQKAKKMSDKELRDSINRIKMEREYVSLTTKEVETGYDRFKDVMGEVRDVAVTAAAVAGLVLTLIKIKKSLGHSDEINKEQMYDLYCYCHENGFSDDVIEHAMDLDLDWVLDHYELTEEDIQHFIDSEDELYHHGILGMKWGVRRYQNYDGTRIGTGGGGGGSNKAFKSFRDTVVGGQGGKAKGNAKLAATAVKSKSSPLRNTIVGGQGGKAKGNARLAASVEKPSKYKSREAKVAVDAWNEYEKEWDKTDAIRQQWFKAKENYGDNDQRTKKLEQQLTDRFVIQDRLVQKAIENYKKVPYEDIDDDVLEIAQHSKTWKSDVKVEDINGYKGPTIQKWSSDKQDFEQYKWESTNPNVEILGDAPGGRIAVRRKPKTPNPIADAKAEAKRKQDLAKSEIQDLKDAYRLTGDRSYLKAAQERERKLKRR